MIWEVAPFPKPRMTQRDKWKKRPIVIKYILFKEAPHQQRPDLDNLIKAFKDALCEEDSHVHTYGVMKKVWGEEPKIMVHDKFVLENNIK